VVPATTDPSKRDEVAAIVGGIIGGLLFLAVIALAYREYKLQKEKLAIQVSQAKYAAAAAASPAAAGFSIVPMQPLPPSDVGARAEWDNQLFLLQQLQTLTASHAATNALPVQQALNTLVPVPAPATFSHSPPHAVGGSFVLSDSGTITFIPDGAVAQDYQHAQAEDQAAMQQLLQLEILQQQFRAQMQQPFTPSNPPTLPSPRSYSSSRVELSTLDYNGLSPRDTAVSIIATPNFPAPSPTRSLADMAEPYDLIRNPYGAETYANGLARE
jgi:hypothetical protein